MSWVYKRAMRRPAWDLRVGFALVVWVAVVAGCGAKTGLETEREAARDGGGPAPRDGGVAAGGMWRTLSMSWQHACAIVDGAIFCWGDNSLGLVGGDVATPAPPTRVEGLPEVVEVATGQIVSCALDRERSVWCWGNAVGTDGPIRIAALPVALRVYVGSGTVCVL